MPRYRANAPLFIAERFIEEGTEFDSSITPGRNWEPLDDAARAAKDKMLAERAPVHQAADATADRLLRRAPAPGTVDIPDNWESESPAKRRAIAQKLGATPTVTAVEANSFITAELDRRAQKAA